MVRLRTSLPSQNLQSYDGFRAVAPVRATIVSRGVQAAFRRTPLKIEAARVGGVEIPNQKRIEFSLQYIYGIGHTTAKAILTETVSIVSHTLFYIEKEIDR